MDHSDGPSVTQKSINAKCANHIVTLRNNWKKYVDKCDESLKTNGEIVATIESTKIEIEDLDAATQLLPRKQDDSFIGSMKLAIPLFQDVSSFILVCIILYRIFANFLHVPLHIVTTD